MKLKYRLNKLKNKLWYIKQCFLHIVNRSCEIEKKAYVKGWIEGFSKARRFQELNFNDKVKIIKEIEYSLINNKDYNCG